jgi:hypothetical protein
MLTRAWIGLLLLAAACGTESVELRTREVTAAQGLGPDAEKARLIVTRFGDHDWDRDAEPDWMKVRLDGEYVVVKGPLDEDYRFVSQWVAFDVDPGTYLFELERKGGAIVAAQSIVLAPGSHNEIVVYGPTGTEHSRQLLDSLGGLAPGQVRARVVNVMDSHVPIDVVSCASVSLGCPPGTSCTDGGAEAVCGLIDVGDDCTVLTTGLAYGAVFEQIVDAGTDVRARVPVRVGEGQVERSLQGRHGASEASFETVYPQHVWGPGDWFEVCTNFLQFAWVVPGTYRPRP